jgi:GT2 family glycosyltransferase
MKNTVISLVIITYNRPLDLLELLENFSQLDDVALLVSEIVIVNNGSTENYDVVESFIKESSLNIYYHISPENLGVSRGRNLAVTFCTGEYLIMLDDDGLMMNQDCLVRLINRFEEQIYSSHVGVVTFQVRYADTGELQRSAFPHKKFVKYVHLEQFETYYFAGGAHAIRRSLFNDLGGYPSDFFYGMEEYDLAFRLLDKDWSILYAGDLVMLHKESPLGRQPTPQKLQMMWRNKVAVTWRYLPLRYVVSTCIMWSLEYLRKTKDVRGWIGGWYVAVKSLKQHNRQPIGPSALAYLRRCEARLWY